MSVNAKNGWSNVLQFPFKTLMSVEIETWRVSFNHPIDSEHEIIELMSFLWDHGVEDVTIKDSNGSKVERFSSLIGENTITLSHDAISLIAQTLEQANPKARKIVSETKENISLVVAW